MKNKSFLLLSVILIAFVVVTSYTPNAVQAEMPKQEEPVSGTQSSEVFIWNLSYGSVGINFVPHDSALTYYNGAFGCLGSHYNGPVAKTFTFPINITNGGYSQAVDFTYYNHVAEPTHPIEVTMFRRAYNSLTTEKLKTWDLDENGLGKKYELGLFTEIYDTFNWLYWLEFKLPPDNSRMFCGFRIWYDYTFKLPPIFPLAFPSVITKP
jgi:hypothetical protein